MSTLLDFILLYLKLKCVRNVWWVRIKWVQNYESKKLKTTLSSNKVGFIKMLALFTGNKTWENKNVKINLTVIAALDDNDADELNDADDMRGLDVEIGLETLPVEFIVAAFNKTFVCFLFWGVGENARSSLFFDWTRLAGDSALSATAFAERPLWLLVATSFGLVGLSTFLFIFL